MIGGSSQGALSGNSVTGGRVSCSQTDSAQSHLSEELLRLGYIYKLGSSLSSKEAHNSLILGERTRIDPVLGPSALGDSYRF